MFSEKITKGSTKTNTSGSTGLFQNRNICFNIRQIQDIIDYAEILNLEGAILFLDFKKAFHTVDRQFLFETLRKFGFHDSFINWVKAIYNNIFARILNNGWKSSKIALQRGVRQGCHMSALLYILVAEILSTRIRKCNDINGIRIQVEHEIYPLEVTQLMTLLCLLAMNEI